ncbi:MAG: hypothetical protein IIC74_08620 [Bacteroidetes bacterium]|nr:hypothetical protein [Bacteroidota bacterium]
MKTLNSRTLALILICLFSILTNAQEQFTGPWFVLRSESRENEYFDTYKTDSISKIGLDKFSHSFTNLHSFLDIKKNGRFKIIKGGKYNGKWKLQNDTIILQLKKSQLYGYIEDNYLKLRVFQDTLKYYDVIIATRLPNSNINNNFSFKGKSFLYKPTIYSSFKFHFLNNNNVIFIQTEKKAKWSGTGSWNLIKHNDYLFLSIKTRTLGQFLFFLLKILMI